MHRFNCLKHYVFSTVYNITYPNRMIKPVPQSQIDADSRVTTYLGFFQLLSLRWSDSMSVADANNSAPRSAHIITMILMNCKSNSFMSLYISVIDYKRKPLLCYYILNVNSYIRATWRCFLWREFSVGACSHNKVCFYLYIR